MDVRYQHNIGAGRSIDAVHYTDITHCTHAKCTFCAPFSRNYQPSFSELLLGNRMADFGRNWTA